MPIEAVLLAFQVKLDELQVSAGHLRSSQAFSAITLAAAVLLFAALAYVAVRQGRIPLWYSSVSLPIAALSARRYKRSRDAAVKVSRLANWYSRAVDRIQGRWPGAGVKGEGFSDSDHPYAQGLHLFGEGSLFELLCTVRTAIGRRRLAAILLEPPPVKEIAARQDAIRELRPMLDLREQIALLGEGFHDVEWKTFAAWLESPAMAVNKALRLCLLFTSSLLTSLVLAGFCRLLPWSGILFWLAILFCLHSAVGFVFKTRVTRIIDYVRSLGAEIRTLREGLELLRQHRFRSAKLADLAQPLQDGQALRSLRKLERMVNALNQRDKDWFYGPSFVVLYATQMVISIECWRAKYGEALLDWLNVWGEFEALNALAQYAYEHPDDIFPEFVTGDVLLDAQEFGHPLLDAETCVRNHLTLGASRRFCIVSGSNMAGKSTLLRAIGLNAVLAATGAPVRAKHLRLSPLAICTSISITDSLLNGKSKFLAEIERIRQTMDIAGQDRPVLFLIDEIFSGTNSLDRRAAVESVVRALLETGAVGLISTHDLALTEIADLPELGGLNLHMASRSGSDPLDFDYQLKPGVSTETNAAAIARLAGIPV
jgi:hypothetical protein